MKVNVCVCVLFLCVQYSLENPDEDALEFGVLSQTDTVTKTFTIHNVNPVQVSDIVTVR